MNENKLVTQILCFFNEEKYLENAINSILNQSYTNFELILIDDGSTDGSRKIAESFQDDRIVHVFNQENHGLAWCRNQGLSLAKGELIGFVDADDIARREKLNKMVDFLNCHEDVLVLSGGYIEIDKYGNKRPYKSRVVCGDDNIRAHMLFGNCITGPCALFRRTVIDQYHIVHDASMRTSQDFFFWHMCLQYGKFENLYEPLMYYRVGHNSQATRSVKRNPERNEKFMLKIFQYAWKSRGFCLKKDEIKYIYQYLYETKCMETIKDYIKGYKLYRKIKSQETALNLQEGSLILLIYKNCMKKCVLKSIKRKLVIFQVCI